MNRNSKASAALAALLSQGLLFPGARGSQLVDRAIESPPLSAGSPQGFFGGVPWRIAHSVRATRSQPPRFLCRKSERALNACSRRGTVTSSETVRILGAHRHDWRSSYEDADRLRWRGKPRTSRARIASASSLQRGAGTAARTISPTAALRSSPATMVEGSDASTATRS